MIRRFQIEDLIVQDSSGVVFRALDTETGKIVAVRRFFPFGLDGGGLHSDEQTAYNIAINRLSGLSHPALRSVICGGCDPVDGMPFIATEWVDGESLQPILDHGPLTPENATELITQALEVCELLSHVLAEEAVWVETELQTIVVGSADSGRRFTFWISPLKWLGAGDEPRGLEAIVNLTEQIMGWKDQPVNDQAGRGLGGWLNWLRNAAATTSLHEARETLAASVGAEPPAPAKRLVNRAARPVAPARAAKPAKPVKGSRPKALLLINIALGLTVAGMGGWVWIRKHPESTLAKVFQSRKGQPQEAAPAPEIAATTQTKTSDVIAPLPDMEPGLSDEAKAERANQRIAELSGKPAAKTPRGKPKSKPGVIPSINREQLILADGASVVIEGRVISLEPSNSGKTLYLMFSEKSDKGAARAGMEIAGATLENVTTKLQSFVGQTVRVTGKVIVRKSAGNEQPDIMFGEPSCVEVVP